MTARFAALATLTAATLIASAPARTRAGDAPKPLAVLVMMKKKGHPFLKHLEDNYRVQLQYAIPEAGKGIPGVEAVGKCDVLLLSQRRQDTTEEQTKALKKALLEDRVPVVGIRQASHAFNAWPEIDREVFGARYGGHFFEGKDKQTVQIEPKGKDNPLVAGFNPFMCNGYPYRYTEVAADVEVLMTGGLPGKMQPVTWTRVTKDGRRAFYTRFDETDLAKSEDCRAMATGALFWAAGKDAEKFKKP